MPGSSVGLEDRLCDLCDRLHGTLAEAGMLGRRCKRRSGILRTLFCLIDLNSAQLNLHIAKLCLAVSRVCVCVSVCLPLSLYHIKYFIQKLCAGLWVFLFVFPFYSPAVCQWKEPAQHL